MQMVKEGDFIGENEVGQGLPEINASLPMQGVHPWAKANKFPAIKRATVTEITFRHSSF